MSGPNGDTPGAPVALRYQGHGLQTFGVCGLTLLNPCLAAGLNGGGSALATPAEFRQGRGSGGARRPGFHFLTFRWQPTRTISARPVTELDLQLDGCELTVLDIARDSARSTRKDRSPEHTAG
jgi:hypothetical protein